MAEPRDHVKELCHVCNRELGEESRARCVSCARSFHLPWSVNLEDRTCGRVIFNKETAGLVLVCNQCIQDLGLGQ